MHCKPVIMLGVLAAYVCAPVCEAAPACPFPHKDAEWLQPAVAAWAGAMNQDFGVEIEQLPQMIVLGKSCAWAAGDNAAGVLGAAAEETRARVVLRNEIYPIYSAPFNGAFNAPNGEEISPAPLAFTSPNAETKRPFFMIAAAAVWRGVLPKEKVPDITAFIKGVAVHELVHTRQAPIMAHLDKILSGDPELADVSDEWLFDHYKDAPGYKESVAAEKAALIAALRADKIADRRRLASEAAGIYRNRQRDFFGDRYQIFRDMEDAFLTMEGVAVWLAFQAAPPDGAGGGSRAIADYYEAGGGGSWVQTEGGLMAALLESLTPTWRNHVFVSAWARLPDLLEKAAAKSR